MNEHDSEILKYDLEDMGYEPTDEVDDAKIIILIHVQLEKMQKIKYTEI